MTDEAETVVEQVARAMWGDLVARYSTTGLPTWDEMLAAYPTARDSRVDSFRSQARAAIAAMRELTVASA